MNGIAVGIVVLYFFLLIILSARIYKASTIKYLSRSSHTLIMPALICGLVMTHYGAGFILGGAELGYTSGLYGLAYSAAAALGVFLLGICITKRMFRVIIRKKIATIPELLRVTYHDARLPFIASGLSFVALTTILAAQFYALLGIISALHLPRLLVAAMLAFFVGVVASKGIGAVVNASIIHLSIILIGTVLTLVFAWDAATTLPFKEISYERISFLALLNIIIPTTLYTLLGQDFYQKVFSAESFHAVRISCSVAAIILIIAGAIPVLVGMKSKEFLSVEPAAALPSLILVILPPVLQGILIASILAAVLGSSQAILSASISHLSEDFFRSRIISERQRKVIALSAAFLLPFIALIVALISNRGIVGLLTLGYTLYIAGTFIPIMVCLFGRGSSSFRNSLFLSSIAGITVAFILEMGIISIPLASIIPAIIVETAVFVVTYKKLH